MKNKILNFISKLIIAISFVILGIFSIFLFKLNMIPTKYLVIFYSIFITIYLVLYFFLLRKNIKKKIKIVSMVLLVLFSMVFCFGFIYIYSTVDFMNKFGMEKFQTEEYEISTLSNSSLTIIEQFTSKKIGVYYSNNSKNTQSAINKLKKEIEFIEVKYENVAEMLEDLDEGNLDAVLITGSIKTLLSSGELDYLNIELKKIDSITIEVKTLDVAKVVDVTNTPFNIYIAGGDSYGNINDVMNTDVNMVMSINPIENKILLTSIPRDYYVNFSNLGEDAYDKLTHAGYYGIETSINAIEELLDIEINYYVKVNFSTLEQIIDAIGGITVYSDYEFTTNIGSYVKYGYNNFNGKQALAFARERYSFVDGDVQRVKNQQKIISATIDKVTSSETLINRYTTILNSVSNSFSTNLDKNGISRLVKKQISNMKGWTIESQNLVGTHSSSSDTYTFPGTELYVMERDEESLKTVKAKINQFLLKDTK